MPVKPLHAFLRRIIRSVLTGEGRIVLESCVPSLEDRLGGIEELGLYLHIPFCRQICPYCPYKRNSTAPA